MHPHHLIGDERAYYATHSPMSDPGERARLFFDALPADPARLVEAVPGLGLHPLFVQPLGITPLPESVDDTESRSIANILARILAREAAPLDVVGRRRPQQASKCGITGG
ncbi:MAG: hypothetical protein C5B48_08450 [Candidatus Rokuibacteriota bacterium]|nr:MAG: hypothetical protein C5B48_08450 [Candidatus Rokubacteria bacterium]